jgi:hypothetical protein
MIPEALGCLWQADSIAGTRNRSESEFQIRRGSFAERSTDMSTPREQGGYLAVMMAVVAGLLSRVSQPLRGGPV